MFEVDVEQRSAASRACRSKTSAAARCLTAHGDHARTSELLLFKDVFEARLLASVPAADHFHEGWRTCDTPATREGQASVGSPHGGESSPLASDSFSQCILRRVGVFESQLDCCTAPDLLRAAIQLASRADGRPTIASRKTGACDNP
jgi:hypothetical protein